MSPRSYAASFVAVLVLASFAGCLGGSDDVPEGAAAAGMDETGLSNVSVDDGTTEMSADIGHMPHLHDYWQGKERVNIMDEEVEIDHVDALQWTFINTFFFGSPGAVGGTFFTLPEGSLVYEGTGQMEIVATWTDPTVTAVGIRYRSPASESFSEVLPLTSGVPLVLEVTPEMTDMPHDKESRWIFILVPPSSGQAAVGTVDMRVDIIRMRDITLFPGHPELFGGAHTLVLFDGVAQSRSQSLATFFVGALTGNEVESGVRSSKVVPMETLTMTANVTITSTASNIGEVSDVDFLYKPAGSFREYVAQVISADPTKGVYQFAWPVEMSQTDSPYADSSQWTFDLLIYSEVADGLGTRRLVDAQVDYTLQVVAYDSVLDGVEPAPEDD